MSVTVIDNEVVTLRFNNVDFEKNVSTSLSTLDKLKQALKFDGARKGLDEVASSAKGINFDSLNSAMDLVNQNFSTMGKIANTVLEDIVHKVAQTGEQMIQSFAIDPIKEGFNEYELKMGSVQTILNSALDAEGNSVSLDVVMDKLNELNTYADKTIYSFSDMTSSIGKFTNAGVDLDKAVMAIQGISNEAAISGANAQQASHAMYNFAQALQTGSVKLIDWKSIENANMATVAFKEELIKTAVAAHTLEDNLDGTYTVLTTNASGATMDDVISSTQNFNDSLQYQWMTSEVLVDTLARYANEEEELGQKAFEAATEVKTFTQLLDTLKEAIGSGWAETWEILIGNYDEAKELWTSVSNVLEGIIGRMADSRNEALRLWKAMNGQNAVLDGFREFYSAYSTISSAIGNSFNEFFHFGDVAELLTNISFKFRSLMHDINEFVNTKENLEAITNIFRGLFAALKIVYNVLHTIYVMAKPLFDLLASGGGTLLGVLGKLGKVLADNQGKISAALDKGIVVLMFSIVGAVEAVTEAIGHLYKTASEFVSESDLIAKIQQHLQEFANFILTTLSGVVTKLVTVFEKIASVINEGILSIADSLMGFDDIKTDSVDNFVGKIEVSTSPLTGIIDKITYGFSKVVEFAKFTYPYVTKFLVKMVDVVGDIVVKMAKYVTTMNSSEVMEWIKTGTFVGFFLEFKKMSGAFGSMGDFFKAGADAFKQLGGVLKDYQKSLKADILKKIAEAVGILSLSLIALSMIPSEKLLGAVGAISALFAELTVSLKLMTDSLGSGGIKKSIGQFALLQQLGSFLIQFSVAIGILTACFIAMSQVNDEDIGHAMKVIAGLEGLLAGITLVISVLPKSDNSLMAVGIAMMFIAKSIGTLVDAVIQLLPAFDEVDKMSPESLKKGGAVLAGMLVVLTGMAVAIGKSKIGVTSAVGLLGMIETVKIAVNILMYLGDQDSGKLKQGLISLGIVSAALSAFALFVGVSKFGTSQGAGLLLMAASLEIIIDVMKRFADMGIGELAKGLLAMGGALVVLGTATALMTGSIAGAVAMILIASSLEILVPALKAFSQLKLSEMIIALGMLAGVLAAFVAASIAMAAFAPALLILAAALIALGAGLVVLSGGLLLFSAAMATIAAMDIAAIIGLIPMLKKMIEEFCDMVVTLAPSIQKAIGAVLNVLFNLLDQYTPRFVAWLVATIVHIIDEVAKHTEEIVADLVVIAISVVVGVIEGLIRSMAIIVKKIFELVFAIIDALGTVLGHPDTSKKLKEALRSFFQGIIDFFKNFFGINSPSTVFFELAGYLIDGLIAGISVKLRDVVNKIGEVGEWMIRGLNEKWEDFKSAGKNILEGLKQGLDDNETVQRLLAKAKDVFGRVRDTISGVFDENSPSKVTYEFGKYVDIGFANGMTDSISTVIDTAKQFGNDTLDAMRKAMTNISELVEGSMDADPTIRPVLDLSDVRHGIGELDSFFGQDRSLELAASANVGMNSIISRNQNGVVVNNNDIIEELTNLRSDFNTMLEAIRSLNIIMDTGTLVGAISEPMDRAFGRMAMMNGRGI